MFSVLKSFVDRFSLPVCWWVCRHVFLSGRS